MSLTKIAVATHFPRDPGAPSGGVEAVSVNLARALASRSDLDMHVVTLDAEINRATRQPWGDVTVHRLPRPAGSELMNAVGAGRHAVSDYLADLAPDLVHAHDTYGLMVKGLNIPRVFTIHGFIYGDTLVSGTRWAWIRSKIWKAIETSGWADQPHIISISPYVRERLAGIARGVIHDIDNPISESFFDIPREDRGGIVFSAAVICPRKNTLRLVEAAAVLAQQGTHIQLRLAGAITEPDYGNLVKDAVRQYGLEDKVVFLGKLDTAQIKQELAAASVFALVSLEENSPMGIEEAMAARVPVVTSNRCGMPYMVRDSESGYLVDPDDARGIAARLAHILTNSALRQKMGETGRAIALDRFHPDRVAERTRTVYLDAIAQSTQRTA